jgi:hypothetical protein
LAVPTKRNVLARLGNQPFVGIQVIDALGLRQRIAGFVPLLLFPNAPIKRVVPIAGNDRIAGVFDFDQAVLAVVNILRASATLGLTALVPVGVVLIADRCATARPTDQAIVGVVDARAGGPGALPALRRQGEGDRGDTGTSADSEDTKSPRPRPAAATARGSAKTV